MMEMLIGMLALFMLWFLLSVLLVFILVAIPFVNFSSSKQLWQASMIYSAVLIVLYGIVFWI